MLYHHYYLLTLNFPVYSSSFLYSFIFIFILILILILTIMFINAFSYLIYSFYLYFLLLSSFYLNPHLIFIQHSHYYHRFSACKYLLTSFSFSSHFVCLYLNLFLIPLSCNSNFNCFNSNFILPFSSIFIWVIKFPFLDLFFVISISEYFFTSIFIFTFIFISISISVFLLI